MATELEKCTPKKKAIVIADTKEETFNIPLDVKLGKENHTDTCHTANNRQRTTNGTTANSNESTRSIQL